MKQMNNEIEAKKLEAQKRANKTGLTHYVGMRYDLKLYVSKLKPRTSDGGVWLKATVEPEVAK